MACDTDNYKWLYFAIIVGNDSTTYREAMVQNSQQELMRCGWLCCEQEVDF
jgi:hypothetical protein